MGRLHNTGIHATYWPCAVDHLSVEGNWHWCTVYEPSLCCFRLKCGPVVPSHSCLAKFTEL